MQGRLLGVLFGTVVGLTSSAVFSNGMGETRFNGWGEIVEAGSSEAKSKNFVGRNFEDLGERTYYESGCYGCHGESGRSNIPDYPTLAGKPVDYLVKQLKDFQSGARQGAYMNTMALGVEGVEREVSEYLSRQ